MRTRAGTQKKRGSVEARKARGTSKNDRSKGEGGRGRGGLKRISATIATAADFQTIRQESGAIARRTRPGGSTYRGKRKKKGKYEENTEIKRLRMQNFEFFINLILIQF